MGELLEKFLRGDAKSVVVKSIKMLKNTYRGQMVKAAKE